MNAARALLLTAALCTVPTTARAFGKKDPAMERVKAHPAMKVINGDRAFKAEFRTFVDLGRRTTTRLSKGEIHQSALDEMIRRYPYDLPSQ